MSPELAEGLRKKVAHAKAVAVEVMGDIDSTHLDRKELEHAVYRLAHATCVLADALQSVVAEKKG